MRLAFDIDGTITRHPEFFASMIAMRLKAGDEVHILTGALPGFMTNGNDEPGDYDNVPVRVEQLGSLGINEWTRLVSVLRLQQYPDVGVGKAEYCRKNEIDLIFEDDHNYINEIARISPSTGIAAMLR